MRSRSGDPRELELLLVQVDKFSKLGRRTLVLDALNSRQADRLLLDFARGGHVVVLLAERNLADTVDKGRVLLLLQKACLFEVVVVGVDGAERLVPELLGGVSVVVEVVVLR